MLFFFSLPVVCPRSISQSTVVHYTFLSYVYAFCSVSCGSFFMKHSCKQPNVNKLMLHCAVRVLWQFLKWIYLSLLYHTVACGRVFWFSSLGSRRLWFRMQQKDNLYPPNNWWSTQICVYIAIMSLLNLCVRYATTVRISFDMVAFGLKKELCFLLL